MKVYIYEVSDALDRTIAQACIDPEDERGIFTVVDYDGGEHEFNNAFCYLQEWAEQYPGVTVDIHVLDLDLDKRQLLNWDVK